MVKLRKILFVIFVAVYLVLCPSLILYSLGIVIKPGQEKVIKTGIIYVSSIPAGASLTLNGNPVNEETPAALSNLMPGTYTLRVSAKKYQSWEKSVPVFAEKVTPVENILLLPNPLNIKELSEASFETIMPVPGNPYLLAVSGSTLADISIYIWDEGLTQNLLADSEAKSKSSKLRTVIPPDFDYRDAKLLRLHTSQDSPYLLFEIENSNNEKKLLWIDPLFGTPKVEDVTDLFPDLPSAIQWDAGNPRHLLSFQNHAINRLDLATKAIYPKILDGVDKFSQSGAEITFITEDRELKSAGPTGNNLQSVSDDPTFNELVFKHFPFKNITSVSNNLTVLLSNRGELITTSRPYLLTDRGIEGFKWNDKPPRLLIWTQNAVGFINFPRRPDNQSEEIPGLINWISQDAHNIQDAFWVNNGSHILYTDNNKIFLTDTGLYGAPDIQEITAIKKDSRIYYSERVGKVFFLNKDNGRLSSVDIVPQQTLLRGMTFETRTKRKGEQP